MAVASKKATAKQINFENVSTIRPDEAVGGGMADNFEGIIASARFGPGKYGSMTKYGLMVHLEIHPVDESVNGGKPVKEMLSAGDLKNFVPSLDGETPAGADAADYLQLAEGGAEIDDLSDLLGYVAIPLNAKKGQTIPSGSNFIFFTTKLRDAGFPVEEMSPDVSCLEGLRCNFQRMVKPKIKDTDKDVKVLVPYEYLGREDEGKSSAKAAKSTATKTEKAAPAAAKGKAASGGGDDELEALKTKVRELILDTLREADPDEETSLPTLPKRDVSEAVVKQIDGKAKSVVVKLLGNVEFHGESDGYTYDTDREVYELVE